MNIYSQLGQPIGSSILPAGRGYCPSSQNILTVSPLTQRNYGGVQLLWKKLILKMGLLTFLN